MAITLLDDQDVGVRKAVLKSLGTKSSLERGQAKMQKVERMTQRDPDPQLRQLATQAVARLKR